MSMNQGAIEHIVAEMHMDRAERERIAVQEGLEECRITVGKEIPRREFLFELFGIRCFPKGELVAITGRAKSGKTFVSSMLISLCAKQNVLEFKRVKEETIRVMWYDTEQSEESTQEILRDRILRMCEGMMPENGVDVFNVRSKNHIERAGLLAQAVTLYRPELVILDGIRDLVDDINNGSMAKNVVDGLMKLASECNCCIVCILHQNKAKDDQNMRGMIGTELTNKAFEGYECLKDYKGIFTLKQTMTRKYDIFREMKYSVNRLGLPFTAQSLYESEEKRNEEYFVDGKLDYARAFREVLKDGQMRTTAMECRFKELTGVGTDAFIEAKKAALAEKIIEENRVGVKEVYVRCVL